MLYTFQLHLTCLPCLTVKLHYLLTCHIIHTCMRIALCHELSVIFPVSGVFPFPVGPGDVSDESEIDIETDNIDIYTCTSTNKASVLHLCASLNPMFSELILGPTI